MNDPDGPQRAGWYVRIYDKATGPRDPNSKHCVVSILDLAKAEEAAEVQYNVNRTTKIVQAWKEAYECDVVRRQMAPGDVQEF